MASSFQAAPFHAVIDVGIGEKSGRATSLNHFMIAEVLPKGDPINHLLSSESQYKKTVCHCWFN
jgi:hypothetical protein